MPGPSAAAIATEWAACKFSFLRPCLTVLRFLQFYIQYSSIGMETTILSRSGASWPSRPALLFYDYILTFPMEVKYMWKERFRLSTLLYIFCRYALIANVVYLLGLLGILKHRVRSIGLHLDVILTRVIACALSKYPTLDPSHVLTLHQAATKGTSSSVHWVYLGVRQSLVGTRFPNCPLHTDKDCIVTLGGRTWALFGKSRLVLAYYSVIAVACIGLDIVSYHLCPQP